VPLPQVTGGITEYIAPDDRRTRTAGGAISGGQVVKLSGNRTVVVAGVGDLPAGVAAHDASTGQVLTLFCDGDLPLKAGAAINAGDYLIVGALGTVTPAGATPDARFLVGQAQEAISNGATGRCTVDIP
jgi:hypothetical protein